MSNTIRRVCARGFKGAVAEKSPDIASLLVVKDHAGAIEKNVGDPQERVCQFAISTGDVDRDGDTIDPNGWDLSNFNKSGVVLWSHKSDELPIATPTATWLENGTLKSKFKFPAKGVYAFADTVYDLIQADVLRATSVGFRPKKWQEVPAREGAWMPVDFKEQELLEVSIVCVPAQPKALLEAKSLGVEMGPYIEWAERALDSLSEAGMLSREKLEKAYFAVRGKEAAVIDKAGRVLSKSNVAHLKQARECLDAMWENHTSGAAADDGAAEPDQDDEPKAIVPDETKSLAPVMDDQITVAEVLSEIKNMLPALIDQAIRHAQGRA